jgi:ATP-dependent exoDNAse (exonuclease V) beta subunit
VRRVEGALAQAITDERGRWVLREHAQSECELALTTWEGGRPVEVILDRTFVDADGTRWIVDYKTGQHEGADAEGFLDKERERYQPQLERYARILARMREHPPGGKIMLGLYFPLMRGWRAWEAPKDRIA